MSGNRAVGGYARSEADLEQIMDGLHEQEVPDFDICSSDLVYSVTQHFKTLECSCCFSLVAMNLYYFSRRKIGR